MHNIIIGKLEIPREKISNILNLIPKITIPIWSIFFTLKSKPLLKTLFIPNIFFTNIPISIPSRIELISDLYPIK